MGVGMRETDSGVTQVVRSKSPPFFKACIDEMRIAGMDVAHKYEWAQVKVPDHILPKARARVARNGGAKVAPGEDTIRTIGARIGYSIGAQAQLAASRQNPRDFDDRTWEIVHVASGVALAAVDHSALSPVAGRRAAMARAAAIETACPSCADIAADKPETLAAFKAEFQIFKEGNGA